MKKIKFVIPKGHLFKKTLETLERAGYEISGGERSYYPKINDSKIELKVLRPQEIPIFISEGSQDVGITGLDWLRENKVNVEILLDLEYSKVKLVVAVPKSWTKINSISDLLEEFSQKNKTLRVATEYLNLSKDFLKSNPVYQKLYGEKEPNIITPWWKKGNNNKVAIYLSFGATEAKPPDSADAIIEVIETGASIEQNDLKTIGTVMESTAVLITNKKTLNNPDKREKIYDILTLLRGVIDARKKIHVFVNVCKENLQKLLNNLPALKKPTIAPLADEGWYSVNTVIDKSHFLKILPILRKLAQGLVLYEPRQVLPLEEIKCGEEAK
jgi:ATP phosphoribosyltransferase